MHVQRNTVALSDILLSVTHVSVQPFCSNDFSNETREKYKKFRLGKQKLVLFFYSQQQKYA
jgi:hypothetical protein